MRLIWNFETGNARAGVCGCYIVFSGFSTSGVILAQEFFLNTTCVTASTAAHPRRKPSDRRD
jgi:hypothetical protein